MNNNNDIIIGNLHVGVDLNLGLTGCSRLCELSPPLYITCGLVYSNSHRGNWYFCMLDLGLTEIVVLDSFVLLLVCSV